jgi:hypothetical protein
MSGDCVLVMTDVVDSTRINEQLGDASFAAPPDQAKAYRVLREGGPAWPASAPP